MGSEVGPDVALLWADGDGGEGRAPGLEVFRGGVAHKLQVLHLSWQILFWAYSQTDHTEPEMSSHSLLRVILCTCNISLSKHEHLTPVVDVDNTLGTLSA